MNKTKSSQIPIVGRLERHVLAKSVFKLSSPLEPIGKGKVSTQSSLETGIDPETLTRYYAAVTIVVRGTTTSNDTENEAFSAECQVIGFYVIEGNHKFDVDTITQAAQLRGALQIYPMARRHLLFLLSSDGPRFDLPLEPDFEILRKPKKTGDIRKKTKNTRK